MKFQFFLLPEHSRKEISKLLCAEKNCAKESAKVKSLCQNFNKAGMKVKHEYEDGFELKVMLLMSKQSESLGDHRICNGIWCLTC